MSSSIQWNGPRFLKLIRAELRRRIAVCCIAVQNHAKELLNVEGAGSAIHPHSYWYGGRKRTVRKKGLVYGHATSSPGEPPRKQFGRLQSSVAHEVGESLGSPVGRVGTNLPYGRTLEQGYSGTRSSAWGKPTRTYTWTLLARPWLRRALAEMRGFIATVMARPWFPRP
jgi:hypothetical protein